MFFLLFIFFLVPSVILFGISLYGATQYDKPVSYLSKVGVALKELALLVVAGPSVGLVNALVNSFVLLVMIWRALFLAPAAIINLIASGHRTPRE